MIVINCNSDFYKCHHIFTYLGEKQRRHRPIERRRRRSRRRIASLERILHSRNDDQQDASRNDCARSR